MGLDRVRSAELKIRISGLSNGIHEYHFSTEPASIGLDSQFHQPVEINAQLDKTTRQMLLRATIRTSGQFQCDRCLEDFDQNVNTEYSMFYTFDETETAKYPEDEVTVLAPDQASIDTTEDVRQVVLLAVPLKLLCREECKGLCPQCGTNWNKTTCDCEKKVIDPRWQGLQGLLDN